MVGECFSIHPKFLFSHHHIITCLVVSKKSYEDSIMSMTEEAEKLLPGGNTYCSSNLEEHCRSTKKENTLKNSCTFSGVVVKFSGIFTCTNFK